MELEPSTRSKTNLHACLTALDSKPARAAASMTFTQGEMHIEPCARAAVFYASGDNADGVPK